MTTTIEARHASRSIGRSSPEQIAALVRLAAAGDRGALGELVDEFEGLLWATPEYIACPRPTLPTSRKPHGCDWRENLDRLQDSSRVGAWLATTARRECLRTLRTTARELPDEDPPEPADTGTPPGEGALFEAERDAALWSAFARLPARDQALLRMLVADPQPSYEEIGAALDMPIGSIGPTRGRALHRLRRELTSSDVLVALAACRDGARSRLKRGAGARWSSARATCCPSRLRRLAR